MGSGKGSNTTTTTSAPNPQAMAAYQQVLERAMGAASKPYQAYTGEQVAPINEQQTTGIGNVNQYAGFAMPYVQSGAANLEASAAPISAADIARYYDPYQKDVIDATQAQFTTDNARQQSQVVGNAAAQGALGGDRVGVAQALTAEGQQRAQAPVIAGLQSQGFQSAVQSAMADKTRQGQAGTGLANVGVAGQGAALSGANAQIGAGTLQQQTSQAQDTADFQEYLRAQGYDFQTAQWLAGIATGVGSQMGGTSTNEGSTSNSWAQLAGLGLSAASLFSDEDMKENIEKIGTLDDGQPIYRYNFKGDPRTQIGLLAQEVEKKHPEAVGKAHGFKTVDYEAATEDAVDRRRGGLIRGFAEGGTAPWSDATSYVPTLAVKAGQGAPSGSKGSSGASSQTDPTLAKGVSAFSKAAKGWMDSSGAPLALVPDFTASGVGDLMPMGMSPQLGFGSGPIYRHGGGVKGFALSGGVTEEDIPNEELPMLLRRPVLAGLGTGSVAPDSFEDRFAPAPREPGLNRAADVENFQAYGGERARELETETGWNPGLREPPPARVPMPPPRPTEVAERPVAGFASEPAPQMLPPSRESIRVAGVAPQEEVGGEQPKRSGFAGILDLSPELRQAMLAAGLSMMANRRGGPGSFLAAAGEGGISGLGVYNKAVETKREAELEDRKLTAQEERHKAQMAHQAAQLAETKRGHDLANDKPIVVGGALMDRKGNVIAKPSVSLLDDETVGAMAEQYLAGDKSVMQNLGRGAQGAENVIRLRQAIQKEAKERGMRPDQIAQAMTEFSGQMAFQRTLGSRAANVEMPVAEARQMIPMVLETSEKVDRTKFPTINSILLAAERGVGGEDVVRFGIAVNSFINVYARAISPTGVPTVSDKEHARELLNTAFSKGQIRAAMDQLDMEMKAAQASPKAVIDKGRELYRREPAGAPPPAQAPKPVPTISTQPQVGERKQFRQGWGVWDGNQWVPERQ